MREYADIIFYNGSVITVNETDEITEAVAVANEKILAVGKEAEVMAYKCNETKLIDLNGRTLMPGFIDSHQHFVLYGMKQGPIIDIDYSKAQSIEEIKALIRQDVSRKAPGEWVVLSGYDHNKLKENRHPSIDDLDEAAPESPVRCSRCCAHMGVYNTKALELAGITGPEMFAPGEVVVDENGKMTGLLKENAHMIMGKVVHFSDKQIREGLVAADEIMKRNGITYVCDAGTEGAEELSAMFKAVADGTIKTRLSFMIFELTGKAPATAMIDTYINSGIMTGMGNDHFAIGPVKIMLDGSSSGPSSATRAPYSHDPNLKGILVWNQEEADEWIGKAHAAGYQVTAHALGDMAVEIMVNAIEKAMKEHPRDDCRHRIEHCGIIDEDLLKRIKNLGIIPVPNPAFVELNGRDYNRFYGDRVDYMFPCKSYLNEGIKAAIGSDAPVTHPNPMNGLYGAVTRTDRNTGEPCGEVQKISMLDAIRMYTYNGAYSNFKENVLGSLEAGKLADMIILSEDILKTPAERIKDILIDLTMIDGKIVYER